MEFYKDHIKSIGPSMIEEIITNQSNNNRPKKEIEEIPNENEDEKEIKKLHEQLKHLEDMVIDLYQEKQIIEIDMIDIMEKNTKLDIEIKKS
jgi:hypothetical protein